jgi:cell pole-organizing protein PopZ
MSDAKDQHEPSMEEILASIRKIISEDGDGAAAAPAAADDVLVLTEEVDENGAPAMAAAPPPPTVAFAPEPAPVPPPPLPDEPSVQLAEPEPEPEFEPVRAEPPPVEPPPAHVPPQEFGRRLISETTATASLAALSELVSRTHREPDIESLPLGNANRTLEDLTRELLRPILKAWLDDNLPELVERIVREEIGRLAIDAQRR